MSETFAGASGCRDVFDTLSAVTVDWLVTNDAEQTLQSRVEFEKQVEDLLQQLNPLKEAVYMNDTSGMDMSDMLSTNIFSFGEMLSSAAQWPEYSELDFGNMEFDRPFSGMEVTLDTF